MKELDKNDVIVSGVDGNAVDSLSTDLADLVAAQTDSAEEIQLSLDKKEKELDDSKQVDAKDGVDVAAADSGLAAMIMAESAGSPSVGGGGASADGGLSTNGKLLMAAGAVGAAGIAAAVSDGGGSGGGSATDGDSGPVVDPAPATPEKFTLREAFTASETIDVEPITKNITYIGFNPHLHGESGVDNQDGNNASDAFPDEDANAQGNDNNLTNEGPLDGGIPLYDLDANFNPVLSGQSSAAVVQKGLMSYITDLTGVDFVQLGLINVANGEDAGSTDLFPDLSDITLRNNANGTQTITVVLSDGTENTAEVQISDQYFTLLSNLLFDSENNLRLYEQEVTFYPQVPVTVDGVTFYQNLVQYESGGGVRMPIILTTTQNNGGTEESGLTSAGDDLIEVGRLDLLHGAYIDGGAGNNTLEIDAKGYYAQPKELLNIQNISIENLPNVYTNGPNADDTTYPDLADVSNGYTNSIVDLSRAGGLESLTISESNFQGLSDSSLTALAGDLTVAGISGTATLNLDGAFSSNDYAFHFRDTPDEGVNLILHNVNFDDGDLILAHNSPTLNIESAGAGNVLEGTDLSGDGVNSANLTTLNISGSAKLYISESIADAFAEGTPAVINAATNTGGVDLSMNGFTDELVFTGTAEADDHLTAISSSGGRNVSITGGNGSNEFNVETAGDITITTGDGANEVRALSASNDSTSGNELEGTVTVTAGDGQNDISVSSSDAFVITAGNGDNRIEAQGGTNDDVAALPVTEIDLSAIVLGDGHNEVTAAGRLLAITAGNGGNEIEVLANNLEINSGTGNDVIFAAAIPVFAGVGYKSAVIRIADGDNQITVGEYESVDVVTGAGDDALTVEGGNINFGENGSELSGATGTENGEETLIVIDLGLGNNTLTLGIDGRTGGVTAVDGSSITGENITLVINNSSDLMRADISGVTAVQMGDSDVLTLSVTQFLAMGGSTAFSSIGSSFGANSVINLVVDQNTSLDALNVDALPRSFDFSFEVMDGVTLVMTAQQLHERVTNQGVTAFVDANGDFAEGTVRINDGAFNFDENDAMKGGSIHPVAQNTLNVFVTEGPNGYARPADVVYLTRALVDTDTDGPVLNPFATENTFLRITGNAGITFEAVAGAVDEFGQPKPNAGDSILLGDSNGNGIADLSDAEFLIDFSSVGGVVQGLTFDNFNNVTAIYGNGGARVDVKMLDDVATKGAGLVSQGVSTFVVVDTVGDNTFWTCSTTQDLEVLGIQGMFGDTVTFGNTERGVDFLMEVEYDKQEGYVVGTLNGEFARPGADAVVNVVGLSALPAGETQMVAGIDLENADSVTVNVTGGNTEILTFSSDNGSDATLSLTINADADLDFPELSAAVESVNASGVAGVLTTSIDALTTDAGLDFVGAAGGTNLTVENAGVDAIDSIGGVGPIALTIIDSVDLTETALTNVTSITLSDASDLALTFDQAEAIDAANFAVAEGDAADLMLVGLSDQLFALASYDVDGTLAISLTLADDPVVTLNPGTDLTGIAALEIPEGTTLSLTMEQFQQLNGSGTLTGLGSVVITDVTQASVGVNGEDLNLDDADLGVDSTVTLNLAESVDLSDADLIDGVSPAPSVDTFNIGAFELTLGDIQDADGVAVIGGVDSILKFTDTSTAPFESIDASGFSVDFLFYTNTITDGGNRNIDDIFAGLAGSIEKVSYFGEGNVVAIDQVATIQETVTVTDSLAFNPSSPGVELNSLTLNMQGGTEIAGNLRVSTGDKWGDTDGDGSFDADEFELVRTYLRELTINSTGAVDVENLLSGVAANVITGHITPDSFIGGQDNNLLSLTINAAQDFILEGDVVLNSNVGADGDSFESNDIEDATGTITITGTADVTLGGIDSSDVDVVSVVVNNTGAGNVFITLDDGDIDATDALAFTGSNINLTMAGVFDLSNDDLSGVNTITLGAGSDLTVSFSQLVAIGAANILGGSGTETLTINGYDGTLFDFTSIDVAIENVALVSDGSDVTVDAATNLTGVDSIDANGGSLTMTAAQFQQLDGAGTITNAVNVTITGLTQADIDAGSFDLSDVTASADVRVEVAEDVNLNITDDIENATRVTISDFHLGLASHVQADDLVVSGGATSIVSLLFDIDFGVNGEIEAAGYTIGTLRAIAETVAGLDVEVVFDNLASSVTLSLFETAEEVGYVSAINRMVVIEDGVAVPGNLIFNGQDDSREIRNLTITFEGDANDGRTAEEDQDGNLLGSVIEGDLILDRTQEDPDLTPIKLKTLTLISQGAGDSNGIEGDINPFDTDGVGPNLDNNLLNVIINADSEFTIGGDILFSSTDADDDTATVTVNGDADVFVQKLDVSDAELTDLVINVNGASTLTVTGASSAIVGSAETVTISGTGNVVLGTVGEGVTDDTISTVDASGLSGDLTMDDVTDVDDADFTFTSGTGVTTMTYSDADPIVGGGEPGITLDFTNAAAGSELRLDAGINGAAADSIFNVLAGANTTIYIDATMDLSGFAASLPTGSTIVLADGATLTLTADQANGLTIIAGDDTGVAGFNGVVNIVNLTNDTNPDDPSDAFDLSGISADVAGTITLDPVIGDADVTLDKATDLGFFSVTLYDESGANDSLAGQTIRFQNVDQAERAIIVTDTGSAASSSTNVVWLFTDDLLGTPVNTDDYDGLLGRLFLMADFIDNNGGDVEDTFTTLPSAILRVPADNLNAVNVLLLSTSIFRTVEIEHFETVGDLIFDDSGIDPEEHIQSVTLRLGGETTVGNIVIDDVFGANVDPASVSFDGVTIVSERAVTTDDALANENFVNDNDGINELGEFVQPDNINTVGNISVGGGAAEIDLLTVTLDTGDLTVLGDSSAGEGADLTVGNIIFDSEVAGSTATLVLQGANKITAGTIDWSDTEITTFTMNVGSFTGIFDPVLNAGTLGETFIIEEGGLSAGVGTIIYDDVTGDELSVINASGSNENITMKISNIDGSDDLMNDAFTYRASTGVNIISVDGATLGDGGVWHFDFTGAATPDSTLTITDSTVFTPTADPADPTTLRLTNVNLVIEGDLDLSQITLDITGGTIVVPAGLTLTLSIDQIADLLADGVSVTGSGTVVVEGEVNTDVDTNPDLDLNFIRTVGIDLSNLTDAGVALTQSFLVDINLNISGAINDGGFLVGFNVVGSDFSDDIYGSILDDTFTMGLGDDAIFGFNGDDTYIVDAGVDKTSNLGAGADVLIVQAGAELDALVSGVNSFVATNETSNDGIATITARAGHGDATIDVSLAGGANGFTLVGNPDDASTLVGSDQNDVIVDGDDPTVAQTTVDILTGNGGDDTFQFAVNLGNTTVLAQNTTQVNVDQETITVTTAETTVTGDEVLVVAYTINGATFSVFVDLTAGSGFDPTVDTDIADAIAAALNGSGAFIGSATRVGNVVTVTADGIRNLEITGIDAGSSTNIDEIVLTPGEGTDVAQVTELTSTGDPTDFDQYSVLATLAGGGTTIAGAMIAFNDIETDVVNEIAVDFNSNAAPTTIGVTDFLDADSLVLFSDEDADNGGFTLELDSTAAFGGSSSTGVIADYQTLDIITDFTSGEDSISFGLLVGPGNYAEAAEEANYADALTAANLAFDGTLQYYLTSAAELDGDSDPLTGLVQGQEGAGILFVDANLDGSADLAVLMLGIENTSFIGTDIVA
ncbi:beta strand repeat-containing protein [Zhongshania sp.]|uniref:beta strand repeat-containing protein n=1 Tax=Zhongshania sp. TaxID=1971902 RepID=UPI0039E5263C